MLKPNMPSFSDTEGPSVPDDFPSVIDAHVHVFPASLFSAIRKWFDENAWHIRYQLASSEIFEFLFSHGIKHVVALQYAHKPGIARQLNAYMAEKCSEYRNQVTGMATVYPGEDNAETILQEGFDAGLGGLKLHAHVQCFDMNADYMGRLYDCCQRNKKPIVMHVGREPKSAAYGCDPYQLCSAEKLASVLRDFPEVRFCVPHLGIDETVAYRKLVEDFDNLWLDTTMAIAGYFPIKEEIDLGYYRPERVMYGSDFPNIPFAWDRELVELKRSDLPNDTLMKIANENATEFFNITLSN